MKAIIFCALLATLMVTVVGCDTSLEGSYQPYTPGSQAAVLWPSPDAPDAQPADYHQAPTTEPSTVPPDSGR